jgi:hypothetical protein
MDLFKGQQHLQLADLSMNQCATTLLSVPRRSGVVFYVWAELKLDSAICAGVQALAAFAAFEIQNRLKPVLQRACN